MEVQSVKKKIKCYICVSTAMQVDGYGLGGKKDSLTKFADVSGCGGWNYSHSLLCRPDG
jgi:hypothetical protein